MTIGLSRMPAKHVRLKPGGSSTLPPSAIIRPIELEDVSNGYLEVMDEFSGCPDLINNPQTAVDILRNLNDNQVTLVAVVNNKVVGSASMFVFTKISLDGKRIGHIYDVAVLSPYRYLGIGRELINSLEEIARTNKLSKLILGCNNGNISYYERLGFEKASNHMRKVL